MIWIDADATPKATLQILFRASVKRQVPLTLVANRWLQIPKLPLVKTVLVSQGADVADDHIAEHCQAGELVITADIPLASRVIEKGAYAITPHGGVLDEGNISERLSIRNFHTELRDSGIQTSGPAAMTHNHTQRFSNALDRWLTRWKASQ